MSAPALSPRICPLLLLALTACAKPAEKLFEVSTDGSTRSGMLKVNDGVVVTNEAGFVTRVGADGTTRWRVNMGRQMASRAVEAKGVVVATTVAGEWFGILAQNGTVPWELPRQPVTRTDLATDGARVYAVITDGSIRCIDSSTGAVLWTRPSAGAPGKTPMAAPLVAGASVVAALGDAGLIAVAWADGAVRWRSDAVITTMAAASDGKSVLVAAKNRTLRRLDSSDGKELWTRQLEAEVTSGPTVIGDRAYLGLGEELHALDVATGETVWKVDAGAPVAPVAQLASTLIVPTSAQDGKVLLYALPTTKPYASFRIDTPVRTAPVVHGDRLLLLGSDGRVLGFRLKGPAPD